MTMKFNEISKTLQTRSSPLKLYVSQIKKKTFQYLHLAINISLQGLFLLKRFFLCSDLFSEKVCHKNKHLCNILFSKDIWFLSCARLKLWQCLHTIYCRWGMNKPLKLQLLTLQQLSTISLIILFFLNVEIFFLMHIMAHNRHRYNSNQINV